MTALTDQLLGLPRFGKRTMVMMVDAFLCLLTLWIAFYLRLDEWVAPTGPVKFAAAASLAIALPVFHFSGLYRSIYRFAGWHTLVAVARSIFIFGILYSLIFTVMGIPGIPRTIGLIQPILLFLGVGLSRSLAGYWLGGVHRTKRSKGTRSNVLIYGAGAAGQQLAAAISRSNELHMVGFVDDHRGLQGGVLRDLRVYAPDQLPDVVGPLEVTEILLAIPSAPRGRRNEIIRSLIGLDVRVRTLPDIMDIAHGHIQIADIQPLEIEDLLGRDIVTPSVVMLGRNITGKTVLVTGAGGSIGSELCRQIVEAGPSSLLLVERSEFALYSIHQELSKRLTIAGRADITIVPLLASVGDERRMREIVGTWRPHTIYHAAAYKHVPLVEHNPLEGVRNNVLGTLTAARIAKKFGVSHFVLISTDKAVRPTNVMGATKRLAEMVLQALADEGGATCFSMVRFGNVLGSSGSVVPLFRQQIADGGPITITHEDITRYFMTVPEAAQLVIQAGAMAKGGEVFVLDMGEPVRIADLARSMIELSGMTVKGDDDPNGDIEIKVIGLRPGEKLYEELLIGGNPEPTSHSRIMKANEHLLTWEVLTLHLGDLMSAIDAGDVRAVRSILRLLVPEYQPDTDLVDWVMLERKAASSSAVSIGGEFKGSRRTRGEAVEKRASRIDVN